MHHMHKFQEGKMRKRAGLALMLSDYALALMLSDFALVRELDLTYLERWLKMVSHYMYPDLRLKKKNINSPRQS